MKNCKNIFDWPESKKHNFTSKRTITYKETKQQCADITVKKVAVISYEGLL